MNNLVCAAILLAGVPLSGQRAPDPIAMIDRIVVGGQKRDEARADEASVVRPRSGRSEPARAGTQLYPEDEIRTGNATQMVILFLDNPSQKSNQVTIDSGSRVRLVKSNSVFLFLGRLLANVRGLFDVRTESVTLGARGTIFEAVAATGGRSNLLVVEGAVDMARGDFSDLGASGDRPALEFNAVSGAAAKAPARVTITNRCDQQVRFEIRPPENLPWVTLQAERVEVERRGTRSVDVALAFDARKTPVQTYRGDLVARCLNCGRLRGCTQDRYSFPIEVRVTSAAIRTAARQQVLAGSAAPSAANADQFLSLLAWNNSVVVAGRPTHPPEGLAPYFSTLPERRKVLEDSAIGAFWQNDPAAYEALGDLYMDWSDPPKALDLYRKAAALNPERQRAAAFLVKLGESLRALGALDDAGRTLSAALAADPRSARAHNAVAALSLDLARIARDRNDPDQARRQAGNAQAAAQRSIKIGPETPSAWTNLGEAHWMTGNYDAAIAAFTTALARNPQYSLAQVGLGMSYHALGLAARASRDQAVARGLFGKGRGVLHQAMTNHADLAAAHVALGNLEHDANPSNTAAAIEHYQSAITGRPRNPAAYFQMGELLERTDPQQAGRFFRTYLRLENPVFLQGARRQRAEAGARLGQTPE